MRRAPLVAALLVAPLALYLLAACVAFALEPPLPVEEALAAQGRPVERALGGAASALAPSVEPPALLVVSGDAPFTGAQLAGALRFAQEGGEAWLLTPGDPAAQLGAAAEGVLVLPGRLTPVGEGSVQVDTQRSGAVAASELRALALAGDAWRALLRTDARSFRDTSGNGALETGEPAGPFVVAAEREWGLGRLVVVGARSAADVPAGLVPDLLGDDARPGRAVLLAGTPALPWGPARALGAVTAEPSASLPWALAVAVAGAGAALLPFLAGRAREARAGRREQDLVARYQKAASPVAGSDSTTEEISS